MTPKRKRQLLHEFGLGTFTTYDEVLLVLMDRLLKLEQRLEELIRAKD